MKFFNKTKIISIAMAVVILIASYGFCITIKEEEELSREFMKVVLREYQFINDPIVAGYVEKVGRKILSSVPSQPFTYHFYIIKQDVYNAFAAPAGHIFVNSGLVEAMDTEDELAGILSHEIAHVVCRHISEKIERSSKIGLATLAGIAAGIFLGVKGAGDAANALTIGSMAAGQSISLAYSREDERQADQLGLKYLAEAGYGGAGLLTVLKKIRSQQWFGSKEIPTYLTTHPAIEERIAYIDSWLETNQRTLDSGLRPNDGDKILSEDFRIAHARLLALYGNEDSALKKFKAAVQEHPEDSVVHYGYGLILSRIGNRKDAAAHLKTALEKLSLDPHILVDLGKVYFLDGKYADALQTLDGAVGIAPGDPEGLFYLGRTYMALEKYESSVSVLEELIKKYPDYDQGYYFLAESYGKQNKLADSHFYLSLHYRNKGDFENATFHLKRALALTDDLNKKREMEEKLKDLPSKGIDRRKPAIN